VPNLKKGTYESDEIASHLQRQDYRHGVRSVEATLSGPLSAGTWKDFVAAAVRRAYAAVTASTALSITIAGTGPTYTVSRSAGSWLTDGYKIGMVGRLSAGAFNAANLAKNLVITDITSATVLVVMPLNGVALVAEGPIASSTFTATGKVTYAPPASQTDSSFSIEDYHSDIAQSEVYTGCKVNQVGLCGAGDRHHHELLPADGQGRHHERVAVLHQPDGGDDEQHPRLGQRPADRAGRGIALATSLNVSLKGNMSAEAVVGSQVYPDIAEGRILVDGSMTVLFADATQRDHFLNEDEVSVIAVVGSNLTAAADFISICLPRVKFNSADKSDGDKSITRQIAFAALYNSAGGAGIKSEQTTIQIQDSGA
jgi:hypothetical protein